LPYAAEFDVRWGDIDNARVVYYPRFFDYFHQTLERWFGEALGVAYYELVGEQNVGLPTVKVETEFSAPLRYGDRVRIELELEEMGSRSITVRYTATRMSDGVVSARAKVKKVAIDNDTFKSIPIPGEWRKRFQTYRDTQAK
jgi:4-hydroxybenzoyl-CoA thioesterase